MGKLQALQSCPSFSELNPTELALLASISELRDLSSGDLLFEEGGESDSLYIIVDGEITVSRAENNDAVLATLQSGETLGEMALMHPTRHRLTAKVSSATAQIAVISNLAAVKLIEARPAIGLKLLTAVSSVLHDKMQAALP